MLTTLCIMLMYLLHGKSVSSRFSCIINARGIAQVLGLWGMGGIGKTTLAAKLFDSLLLLKPPNFGDATCFLANVRSEATAGRLVKLQQEL